MPCSFISGSAAADSSLQTRHAELVSPPCGSESNYAGFALEKRLLSKQSLGGGLPDLYIPGFAAPVDSPGRFLPWRRHPGALDTLNSWLICFPSSAGFYWEKCFWGIWKCVWVVEPNWVDEGRRPVNAAQTEYCRFLVSSIVFLWRWTFSLNRIKCTALPTKEKWMNEWMKV